MIDRQQVIDLTNEWLADKEYFLVDESLYATRPDLLMTGRTLLGHESAKNQQLEDFWDDLYNLNGERIHYTGMLSLKQLKIEDCSTWLEERWILGTYKPFHVVDGQQRLTTFIILLNSILGLAFKLNEEYYM